MKLAELISNVQAFWKHPFNHDDYEDLLHIPSITIPKDYLGRIPGCLLYEERLLCFLLHLNNPNNKVFYITSMPVSQSIVEYYLSLLTQVSPEEARKRLTMISCYDNSVEPLCQKMLSRPHLMKRLKDMIDPSRTYMSTYIHTELEEQVALKLGIERNLTPIRSQWGTKLGSRQIFKWCEIPHCFGLYELLESAEDLVEGALQLKEDNPALKAVIIKLNEGVDGLGNAIWNLPNTMDAIEITKSLICRDLWPRSGDSPRDFLAKVVEYGAIMEEFIEGHAIKTPSAQGIVGVDGTVSLVSTHEQVCVEDQYRGCAFPANPMYRLTLQGACVQVGEFLRDRGVRNERFGVDFMAWPRPDNTWELRAIGVNLRHLGTTHPMMTLQLVTYDGRMNQNGDFLLPNGEPRSYFAIDAFTHELLKHLTPDDLLQMIEMFPDWLKFNKATKKGTIFYMMDALASYGSVGIMCIGETTEQAARHFDKVTSILLREAAVDPGLQIVEPRRVTMYK